MLTVVFSVTKEFESAFTHENHSQQGSSQIILPVLEKQRLDRDKLRHSVCWKSNLGSHRINLWVSAKVANSTQDFLMLVA